MNLTIKEAQQDIFDRVVRHLYTMPGPSIDDNENCVYRTKDGNRCAVGCLIPDEYYSRYIEGSSVSANIVLGRIPEFMPDQVLYNHGDSIQLLANLQRKHDHSTNWDGNHFLAWRELDFIAYDYELDTTVLNEYKPIGA